MIIRILTHLAAALIAATAASVTVGIDDVTAGR